MPAINSGPKAREEATAAHHLDELIGHLETKLNKLHLPIDLIIVADHGMEKLQGGWINLDHWADLSDFVTDGALMYPKSDAAAEKAYEQLKGASDKFNVYRRRDFPAELHYNSNPRIGDPVVVAERAVLDSRESLYGSRRQSPRHKRHAWLRSISLQDDACHFLRGRTRHTPRRNRRAI